MADMVEKPNYIQEILKLAFPVGAAIAGTANKRFLPAAAGFSQGFAGQIERQRQEKQAEIDELNLLKKKATIEQELQDKKIQQNLDKLQPFMEMFNLQPGQAQPDLASKVMSQTQQPRTQPTPEEEAAQQSLVPKLPPQIQQIVQSQAQKPSLFAMKPSISFNPSTGSMTVGMSQVENPQVKLDRETRLAEEQKLRDFRNDFNSLVNFGGTVDEKRIKEYEKSLGFTFEDQLEAGRGEPKVDANGNRKWRILSNKEWDTKITRNKFSPDEIEHLQTIRTEYRAWENVERRLSEIGITPESLSKMGSMEFVDVNSPIGIVSLPAKFKLIGQLSKDPRYEAVRKDVEAAFLAFRTRITGAQASDKELKYLRTVIANMQERPGVFFASINNHKENAKFAFNDRLDIYERAGRDTSRFQDFFATGTPGEPTKSEPAELQEGQIIRNANTNERFQVQNGRLVPYSGR